MSRNTYIYPYKTGSRSVSNLSEAMGLKKIRREGSRFSGAENKIVINWGNKMLPDNIEGSTVINMPEAVSLASNKLTFFNQVKDTVSIPEFTTNKEEAQQWLEAGSKVVVRELLEGSGGRGIVLIEDSNTWDSYDHNNARMYVKYIPKKDEYRIHVMNGEVIDAQRKARSSGYRDSEVNWQIRNHDMGFVFVREGVEPPEALVQECKNAVAACGLDFGAVDVVWNARRATAYVLEINTAPGLEGTTVDNYSEGLQGFVDEIYSPAQPRQHPRRTYSLGRSSSEWVADYQRLNEVILGSESVATGPMTSF